MKDNKNTATVLVHPFDSEYYNTQNQYCLSRDKIIQEDNNLYVLTFNIHETLKRLGGRKAKVIPTREANPLPYCGWRNFSKMLENYDEVIFCGAELHFDENGRTYTGCVLEAFEKTRVINKKINFDACWIGD